MIAVVYQLLQHTADVRLKLINADRSGLFCDALLGMMQILQPKYLDKEVVRKVEIQSADTTTLLIDFLAEVLALAQINKEAYQDLTIKELTSSGIKAMLSGKKVKSYGDDIKAVTYHEAEVKKNAQGEWETTIIFDI